MKIKYEYKNCDKNKLRSMLNLEDFIYIMKIYILKNKDYIILQKDIDSLFETEEIFNKIYDYYKNDEELLILDIKLKQDDNEN